MEGEDRRDRGVAHDDAPAVERTRIPSGALTGEAEQAREMQQHPNVTVVGFVPGDIRTAMNPSGSEDPSAAVRRLNALLDALEPRHSGALYVQGRFAVPSFAFLPD